MSNNSSNSSKEWNKKVDAYLSKRISKKIKDKGSKSLERIKKTAAKNLLRKTAKRKVKRIRKTKKKKKAASWRIGTKMGKISKAAKKRMSQKFKSTAKSFIPKFKKLQTKKLSFKETIRGLKGKSKLKSNVSSWKPSGSKKIKVSSKSWKPSGAKSKAKATSRKPTGAKSKKAIGKKKKKKTRKRNDLSRRGMMYLEDDPERMMDSLREPGGASGPSFHSMFPYGTQGFDGKYVPYTNPKKSKSLFGLASHLTIKDLNKLRLTDWKTFKSLDPRNLNPNVQKYFRTFYENSRPGYAIPFTSKIGKARENIKDRYPELSKIELKAIRKSLYADQNPDRYGVDDWEHAAFMDVSRKTPGIADIISKRPTQRELMDINIKIKKNKKKLARYRMMQRETMQDRLLKRNVVGRKDGKTLRGIDLRWHLDDDGRVFKYTTRGTDYSDLPYHLEVQSAIAVNEFKDKKIQIVTGALRELKERKRELMQEIRSANPGVGVNVAPYLRNRYDEMREIPYQERTQEQRDEKDRLLKQMIKHGVSLPSSDSMSSYEEYHGLLGEDDPIIKHKQYADRRMVFKDMVPARKHGVSTRYRPMGYSEKRADRSKYFSRIAQEKANEALRMATIYSQQAENLANEAERSLANTMNTFMNRGTAQQRDRTVDALTRLQSMQRGKKPRKTFLKTKRSRAATRIQALQRARASRKLLKGKKYYEKILPTGKGIYKRGVLVRCIDDINTQYQRYGHIKYALVIDDITEDTDEEYIVHFIGSEYGDYRMRRSQIVPVFQFDSTSIPEADWMLSHHELNFKRGHRVEVLPEKEDATIVRINQNSGGENTYNVRFDDGGIAVYSASMLRLLD